MELSDGLNSYMDDTKFWNFTLSLEIAAREVTNLVEEFGESPSDDALLKAHTLLIKIELWKAGCIEELTGNYAVQNSKSVVWNAFRDAIKAMNTHNDIDALLSIMLRLKGFGSYPDEDNRRRAKRASAVLRIFNPDEWGVVDWRTAAMWGALDKNAWNVAQAVEAASKQDANNLRKTFEMIDERGACAYNQTYRDKRSATLPRTADVEMAIFGLSCIAWPLQPSSTVARKRVA